MSLINFSLTILSTVCQDTWQGQVSTGMSMGIQHRHVASEERPVKKTTPPNATAPRHACHTAVTWIVLLLTIVVLLFILLLLYILYT